MFARQPRVLLVVHAQQLLPQLFKGSRASCQAFDSLGALCLLDAVKCISHATETELSLKDIPRLYQESNAWQTVIIIERNPVTRNDQSKQVLTYKLNHEPSRTTMLKKGAIAS